MIEHLVTGQSAQESHWKFLRSLFNLSELSFKERDELVEVLRSYRSTKSFEMESKWEARSRKLHGDRYDFRKNMVSMFILAFSHCSDHTCPKYKETIMQFGESIQRIKHCFLFRMFTQIMVLSVHNLQKLTNLIVSF